MRYKAYLLSMLTGLVFLLIERRDEFVRFHAMQSIITFGGLTLILIVLGFIPVIGPLLGLVGFIVWITLMITAFQKQRVKLPHTGTSAVSRYP